MSSFDASILHFLNQFAQRSWLIDSLISQLGDNSFLKGGVITAILWWLWFREGQTKSRDREFILGGLLTSLAALFAARTLARVLPFRERPLHIAELHFVLPYGVGKGTLIGWNSFPSDHAVLYFSLAACHLLPFAQGRHPRLLPRIVCCLLAPCLFGLSLSNRRSGRRAPGRWYCMPAEDRNLEDFSHALAGALAGPLTSLVLFLFLSCLFPDGNEL